MNLHRRRPLFTTRRTFGTRARPWLGRASTLEVLEGRELLAGSPWQNALNPIDVNNDLRVTPRDALVIINDLIAHGSRSLDAPAAAPLAATTSVGGGSYVDVNGDLRVTPRDLLIVVNELQDEDLLRIEVFPTDLADNPIATIAAGELYKLHARATDIRDPVAPNPGVFAAAVDVTFNTSFSSIDTNQAVAFDPFWDLVQQSTLVSDRVIAYASTGRLTPPGNAPQPLWSVVLTATGSGTQMFAPGFSTDPNHENLLYGLNDPLPAGDIQYIGSTLTVLGEALFISDVTQAEDSGSPFNFTVTLSAAADEVVTVRYATSDGSATASGPDADYVATTGTLTFNPGETVMTIPVTVNADLNIEPDETFTVMLSNAMGNVNIGDATGVGTIVNDDFPPSLSVSDVTVSVGSVNTTATFLVTLAGLLQDPVSVGFATADNTAVAGIDYLANTGNLTFVPGGPTEQEINVTVLASTGPKPDRSFFVNLSSPTNPDVIIADGTGVGTIVTQGLSISDATVVEGNSGTTQALFTVTLTRPSLEPITVAFQTDDITATAGVDYTSTSGTLTFQPGGASTQVVTVLVSGDTDVEANERFAVNLSEAMGAPLFNSQGVGTILNDDGQKIAVSMEVLDSQGVALPASEALDVGEEFTLQVFVQDIQADPTGVFSAFIDVLYNSSLAAPQGTVTYGSFYQNVRTGTFQPGLLDDFGAAGNIATPPADPSEPLLLFSVPFTALAVGLVTFDASIDDVSPSLEFGLYGSDIAVTAGEINLLDRSANIGENVIAVTDTSAPESGSLVFAITRFLPENTQATVVYTTVDGTAAAGEDYVAQSGTLTFAPGSSEPQMVTIALIDDTIDEPNETMFIQLSGAVNASEGPPGTGTILDDDGEPSVSLAGATGAEGASLLFTASLSEASGKSVTVAFNTQDGSATGNLDYQPTSGTITFAPGVTQQLITVQALGDILLEPNENFQLVLSNPVNASLGAAQAQGTIVDVPPAGISGFVYVDVNNNGIKEANETGIAGAIVTATRPSDGFTQSTVTAADGSYLLTGLVPGEYTIHETQPGFYSDGRDTRFGVESPANDQFTGIVLAPSAAESGFHFGERGVRPEFISAFINRRALFASAVVGGAFSPTLNMSGSTLDLRTGDLWVSFDGGWSGLRTIEALYDSAEGSVTMRLYNNALQEVAIAAPTPDGSVLLFNGQTGQPYFLRLSGTNPNVVVQVTDSVLPASAVAPGDESDASDPPAADQMAAPAAEEDTASVGGAADAVPMTEAEIEPLASSDAQDEALGEGEDWVLEALLA